MTLPGASWMAVSCTTWTALLDNLLTLSAPSRFSMTGPGWHLQRSKVILISHRPTDERWPESWLPLPTRVRWTPRAAQSESTLSLLNKEHWSEQEECLAMRTI